MNMSKFLNIESKDKKQLIEELEFYYFLKESYYLLLEKKNKTENQVISNFLEVIDNSYNWQSYKINHYLQALFDHVFWQESEFYRRSMEKFVTGEINGAEFVDMILHTIIHDQRRALALTKDFKKQALLELDTDHYGFGNVVSDLLLLLEAYQDDLETDDNLNCYITEEELRTTVKVALAEVQKYFN